MSIHRRQLSDFLKSCRARLLPSDLGLPDGGRRRTPGLRREDVAALAGVSVTWYTWLEQGRDIKVSEHVLEQIASTLNMSADEREYLFSLVQHRPPPPVRSGQVEVSDTLRRMITALRMPALVMTERWDVLEWNDLVTVVFRDYGELAPEERNLMRILILNKEYQLPPDEYEEMTHRTVPKFRMDFSQSADPDSFTKLIDELSEASPMFDQLWHGSELTTKSQGLNAVSHPRYGGMTFEHSSYVPEGFPTLRVLIFVPIDEASAKRLDAIYKDL